MTKQVGNQDSKFVAIGYWNSWLIQQTSNFTYSHWSQIGFLPYFHTWCGLSADLECRSEMCYMWLAENTGRKNYAKNGHLLSIAQLCWATSFTIKACIDNQKKRVKQQYVLHMSSHYGDLPPTNGWDRFRSFGHPSKFPRVSSLSFITATTSQWRSTKLCMMFGCLLGWYIIYTFLEALAP